jgi:L-proline amide hydrolase
MILEATREGTVTFRDMRTWYRVTGDLDSPLAPVVIVHGGPGATHNYLLSLSALALTGRPVIHYDQVGCGNSTHRADAPEDLWSVGLFRDELANLLDALGVATSFHLLGQSWGGMLGAEFALTRPAGLKSLILSNSPASMQLWVSEAKRLRADLPVAVRETLDTHEAAGSIDDPEYVAATQAFYDRHVCRVVPNPPEVQRSWELMAEDPTVYRTMNGPNEFYCIGSLRTWSVVGRLSGIDVATLVISGRYDEATPATVAPFVTEIADAHWEVFDDSSHMPFVEEPERYLDVVNAFLREHD